MQIVYKVAGLQFIQVKYSYFYRRAIRFKTALENVGIKPIFKV